MLGRYRPLNPSAQARDDVILLVNRSELDRFFEDAVNATTGWRSSYRYTVRAVLTGMVIAVAVGKPTVKTMTEEVWHLAGDQEWLEWAGMQRITPEGAAALEADVSDRLFWREVDLFRRVYEAMHDTIDDSLFPRGRRKTQRERAAIRRKLAKHPELQEELAEKDEHFIIAINAFPGAASDPGHWRPSNFNGSLAVDETLAHTRIPTRAHDGANIHANQGAEADGTYHYDKDVEGLYNWDFLVQTAVPAGEPYGRWPPNIVAGIYISHDIGEDDGDGALAAIRAAILNGWGPSLRGHPICFADQGIGRMDSFARKIWKLGYQPSFDQEMADRVKLIRLFTNKEIAEFPRTRSDRVKVPAIASPFLFARGVVVSRCARVDQVPECSSARACEAHRSRPGGICL